MHHDDMNMLSGRREMEVSSEARAASPSSPQFMNSISALELNKNQISYDYYSKTAGGIKAPIILLLSITIISTWYCDGGKGPKLNAIYGLHRRAGAQQQPKFELLEDCSGIQAPIIPLVYIPTMLI
jgi:hypothetical protein